MSHFEISDGEKCVLLRRRLRITQAEAAELLNVCHVTVRKIEGNKRDSAQLLRILLRVEASRKAS